MCVCINYTPSPPRTQRGKKAKKWFFPNKRKGGASRPQKPAAAARPYPPQGTKNPPEAPYQANFKEGAGATTHLSGCEPHPTPPAAAQPSIEPPRQTSIMAPGSTPAQADWAASKGPKHSDRRLWPSGSRAQPWSLFAFFLSTQKEGPRRRGGRRDVLKIAGKGGKGTRPKQPFQGGTSRPLSQPSGQQNQKGNPATFKKRPPTVPVDRLF